MRIITVIQFLSINLGQDAKRKKKNVIGDVPCVTIRRQMALSRLAENYHFWFGSWWWTRVAKTSSNERPEAALTLSATTPLFRMNFVRYVSGELTGFLVVYTLESPYPLPLSRFSHFGVDFTGRREVKRSGPAARILRFSLREA